jgi:hypothetical protein
MSRFTTWRRTLAVAAVLLLAGAGAAVAQDQTGTLFGTVSDTQGSRLPGVRVELTGIGAPRTAFTDAQGNFRFPNLDPGTYALSSSLEGFSTVEFPSVNIRVGRSTTLEVQLSPAVEEVITVTSESPLLDERRVDRGVTVSQIELEKIPTARDPWAIVTQTPGVLSDRINVGGNESGQQAVFAAPGTSDDENSFAVDGVLITDMAAIGASPTYYDFDQFEEIQVSTGGTDIEKVGAGASLNLVTKRGSNNPRGSARYLLTESSEQFGIFEQAEPDFGGELENGDGNGGLRPQNLTNTPGNSINEVIDFGFEAGGPIMRDRLWIWGSYGRNDIKQNAQDGTPDNTLLENTAIKLNGQVVPANSLVGSWNRGDKLKDGRRPASNAAPEATWNQDGPTEIWKLEDTHVFSSDFYLTGLYSYVDGGFQLQSKGASYPSPGLPIELESILDTDGLYHRSYYGGISDRNADNYQLDGSYFFNTGNLNHELKFGVSYRDFESVSDFGFPGRNLQHVTCQALGTCGIDLGADGGAVEDNQVIAWQAGAAPVQQTYTAGWIQDTLTAGNWTLNGGLRYDLQEGENAAASVPANPEFPELLTAKTFTGNDPGFEWETISPRLGLTYALGAERKTLLRASYARFAEQLQTGNITPVNPVGLSFVFAYYADADGNQIFTDRTTDPNSIGFVFGSPTLTTVSEIDSSLDPSVTDELVFGVEHAFLPEFVVGADVTWRLTSDLIDTRPFVTENGVKRVARAEDYVIFRTRTSDGVTIPHLPDGTPWSADLYGYRTGVVGAGGNFITNGDSEIEYLGGALTFTKRLASRWMARGYLSYGEGEFNFGDEDRAFANPTDAPTGADGSASSPGGDLFVIQSAGSGPFENTFIQSTWSANLNGMYQVAPDRPWGFNLAGNLYAREGYPLLYSWDDPGPNRTGTVVASATSSVDQFRSDDIATLDLRIEKDMRFTDNLSGILSLDAFNVSNETYIMSREVELDDLNSNHVTQTLSPRIYRLGFRLNWR